jgi:hypothetical protein
VISAIEGELETAEIRQKDLGFLIGCKAEDAAEKDEHRDRGDEPGVHESTSSSGCAETYDDHGDVR